MAEERMTPEEAVARATMAAEGAGHNDPPTFDDIDETQKRYRLEDAHITIKALELCGYKVMPH